MRRHASMMSKAIELAEGNPTEAQRQEFRVNLVATFDDAQSAWDAYRTHLVQHGLLPSA
jgi:hypothetical protein